ncbi:hypothetical protein BOH71_18950 [Bacillus subtilis]|nr:hypothetical protein BOH71_18950 [Bacillus subtilis]
MIVLFADGVTEGGTENGFLERPDLQKLIEEHICSSMSFCRSGRSKKPFSVLHSVTPSANKTIISPFSSC